MHYVTAEVDGGPIIDQAAVRIEPDDTLVTFTEKMHAAEHQLLPAVIARLSVETEAPIRILLLKALIQAGTYEGAKGVCIGLRDANPDVRAEARKILSAWYEQPMPDAMPAADIEALVHSRPPKLLRVQ